MDRELRNEREKTDISRLKVKCASWKPRKTSEKQAVTHTHTNTRSKYCNPRAHAQGVNVAKEVGGRLFEVGVFLRDYGNEIFRTFCKLGSWKQGLISIPC